MLLRLALKTVKVGKLSMKMEQKVTNAPAVTPTASIADTANASVVATVFTSIKVNVFLHVPQTVEPFLWVLPHTDEHVCSLVCAMWLQKKLIPQSNTLAHAATTATNAPSLMLTTLAVNHVKSLDMHGRVLASRNCCVPAAKFLLANFKVLNAAVAIQTVSVVHTILKGKLAKLAATPNTCTTANAWTHAPQVWLKLAPLLMVAIVLSPSLVALADLWIWKKPQRSANAQTKTAFTVN